MLVSDDKIQGLMKLINKIKRSTTKIKYYTIKNQVALPPMLLIFLNRRLF